MGVLRVSRSDLFSLGFCKRRLSLVQVSVRGADGGGIWSFSGGVRDGDSDRGLAALSVLGVVSSVWLRNKDAAAWRMSLTAGDGGLLSWPPEFRRRDLVHLDLSTGQRNHPSKPPPALLGRDVGAASARVEELLYWKYWPPEMVVHEWSWRRRWCLSGVSFWPGRSWVQSWVWARSGLRFGPLVLGSVGAWLFGFKLGFLPKVAAGVEEGAGMT